MKTIKAYLENQKELAYVAFAQSLQGDNINLLNGKHYLERIVHLELLIKELNNGKEKREKA
jgi:hypothetical protein